MNNTHYTIGIKRRFLPFWKHYKVVSHKTEALAGSICPRLLLTCLDGSVIVVPKIDHKYMKLFPDFVTATKNLEKLKSEKPHAPDGL